MLEIDGSIGEGGGQVMRTALTLSAVLGEPVRLFNIRSGREKPGMMAQHFTVVRALQQISNAEIEGARLGSTELVFKPGKISPGEYSFDIETAGSVVLVLQAVMPALMHASGKSKISLTGGTHVMRCPNFDEFHETFLPAMARVGCGFSAKLEEPGFFPKGGGNVSAEVSPSKPKPHDFTKHRDEKIGCIIRSSNLPLHVGERESAQVKKEFPGAEVKKFDTRSKSTGNAVTLYSGFLAANALGAVSKSAEEVAKEACGKMRGELSSGACVDGHLADQLLLYLALAGKGSLLTSELTMHTKTNMIIIEKFLGKTFEAEGNNIRVVK